MNQTEPSVAALAVAAAEKYLRQIGEPFERALLVEIIKEAIAQALSERARGVDEATVERGAIAAFNKHQEIMIKPDRRQMWQSISQDHRNEWLAEVRAALAAIGPGRSDRDALREALKKHHQWHLESGSIGLSDGQGGWIEIDNAAEYSDSLLCAETIRALNGGENV